MIDATEPYIQINNTKIDNHFLESSPIKARKQIEEIIFFNQSLIPVSKQDNIFE